MSWWAEPVLRFVQYALLLGLFGWSAFRLLGLSKLGWLGRYDRAPVAIVAAMAAPVASSVLMLQSIAAMMGQPISALDGPMIEAMILQTDMGAAFLVRVGLLLTALGALLTLGRRRGGLAFAALFYAATLLTLGWSGHAAATEGGLGLLHRANNGVHLIAAGLWLGAIGWFLLLIVKCHTQRDESRAGELVAVMHAFAPVGVVLVGVVALTGLINAHLVFGLENAGLVVWTPYGVLLVIKVALVLAMLACGAHNAQTSRAYIADAQTAPAKQGSTVEALRRSLAFELLFGIATTALVALLGNMSPTGITL